jgi:hypothetical protein
MYICTYVCVCCGLLRTSISPRFSTAHARAALGFRNHVGTDAKISSHSSFDRFSLPSWAIRSARWFKHLLFSLWLSQSLSRAAYSPSRELFSHIQPLTLTRASGPTSDALPPFQFSTSPFANTSHVGLPDLFDFPWVSLEWTK